MSWRAFFFWFWSHWEAGRWRCNDFWRRWIFVVWLVGEVGADDLFAGLTKRWEMVGNEVVDWGRERERERLLLVSWLTGRDYLRLFPWANCPIQWKPLYTNCLIERRFSLLFFLLSVGREGLLVSSDELVEAAAGESAVRHVLMGRFSSGGDRRRGSIDPFRVVDFRALFVVDCAVSGDGWMDGWADGSWAVGSNGRTGGRAALTGPPFTAG